jgi:hypothetical protein
MAYLACAFSIAAAQTIYLKFIDTESSFSTVGGIEITSSVQFTRPTKYSGNKKRQMCKA